MAAVVLSRVFSAGVLGIDAYTVEIEADVAFGLPAYNLVGLPDSAVKEGFVRVRAALENSGFPVPPRRVTVNLAPADVRKDGAAFDLPIALALLLALEMIPAGSVEQVLVLGELGWGNWGSMAACGGSWGACRWPSTRGG